MKPTREHATNNEQTFMVTAVTDQRKYLFRPPRWCELFIEILYKYRAAGNFTLREFVVMRDHVHLLITPTVPFEKAVQLIQGGFSHEAGSRFGYRVRVWQRGFADDRAKTGAEYAAFVDYIHQNPVRARVVAKAEEYPFSSAFPGFVLDEVPQGLKPKSMQTSNGTAEAELSQSTDASDIEYSLAKKAGS